jgi:hypothetical protein
MPIIVSLQRFDCPVRGETVAYADNVSEDGAHRRATCSCEIQWQWHEVDAGRGASGPRSGVVLCSARMLPSQQGRRISVQINPCL